MKKQIGGVAIAAMFGMGIVVAAQGEPKKMVKDEQPVTIQGCVKAGGAPDTFLLMRVTEVKRGKARGGQAVPMDAQGRDVLYSLSTTKGLKLQDGHRVEVTGTIDMNNPVSGESSVKSDSSKRMDSTSEIKVPSEGKKVTTQTDTKPQIVPDAKADAEKSTTKETQRVVYPLKVKSVKGVSGACF